MKAITWDPAAETQRVNPRAAQSLRGLQIAEYTFYFNIFYAAVGDVLGLTVGSLGFVMRAGLAVFCILRLSSRAVSVYRSVVTAVLCAVSFIAIQMLAHETPLSDSYLRSFVPWILAIIITRSLFMRPGFLGRALMAIFIVGVSALPFLEINNATERAGISAVALGNPNSLAAWFGFCSVGFMVRALESRGTLTRWMFRLIALFSLFIVSLTVGRAALAAFAIAAALAFRKQLKRSFLPVLVLILIAAAALAAGLFDSSIALYTERGTVETGRLLVWPIVAKRVLESPILGVASEDFGTYVPGIDDDITPHSGLLLIALGGGFIALLFFVAHWTQCFQAAFKAPRKDPDSPYLLPLLVFSFLIMVQSNTEFMQPWCVLAVSACLHHVQLRGGSRFGRVRLMLKRQSYRELAIPVHHTRQ
jgi:O-antigen ligase